MGLWNFNVFISYFIIVLFHLLALIKISKAVPREVSNDDTFPLSFRCEWVYAGWNVILSSIDINIFATEARKWYRISIDLSFFSITGDVIKSFNQIMSSVFKELCSFFSVQNIHLQESSGTCDATFVLSPRLCRSDLNYSRLATDLSTEVIIVLYDKHLKYSRNDSS